MAYFPNGTAGEFYEAEYCSRCAHQESCSVLAIHMWLNYDQCEDTPEGKAIEGILDTLIPRSKDKLSNEQCTMFIEGPPMPSSEPTYEDLMTIITDIAAVFGGDARLNRFGLRQRIDALLLARCR